MPTDRGTGILSAYMIMKRIDKEPAPLLVFTYKGRILFELSIYCIYVNIKTIICNHLVKSFIQ